MAVEDEIFSGDQGRQHHARFNLEVMYNELFYSNIFIKYRTKINQELATGHVKEAGFISSTPMFWRVKN